MSFSRIYSSPLFGHVRPLGQVVLTKNDLGHFLPGGGEQPDLGDATVFYRAQASDKPILPSMTRRGLFLAPLAVSRNSGSTAEGVGVEDGGERVAGRGSISSRRSFLTKGAIAAGLIGVASRIPVRGNPFHETPAAAANIALNKDVPPTYQNQEVLFFNNWDVGYNPTPWKVGDATDLPLTIRNANPADYTFATTNIPGYGNINYFGPWNSLPTNNYFEFGPGSEGNTQWPGHHANVTYPNGQSGQFLYTRLNGSNSDEDTIKTDYLQYPTGNPWGKVVALSYRFTIPSPNYPEFHVLSKLGADSVDEKPAEVWIVVSDVSNGRILQDTDGQAMKFKVKLKGTGNSAIDNATQFYFRMPKDTLFLSEGKEYEVTFYAPVVNEGQKLQVRTRVYNEWPEDGLPPGQPSN